MTGIIAQNVGRTSGLIKAASGGGGVWTLIKTLTASADSTLSFIDGTDDVVLDSTYPIYRFSFINLHPSDAEGDVSFQVDTGTNTSYDQTITSTYFYASNRENDAGTEFRYYTYGDQAEGTAFQPIAQDTVNDNDTAMVGTLYLFNPSSTTFVKHFISEIHSAQGIRSQNGFCAGYVNTTTALTRIQFKMHSGNIDAGKIKMYGLKDSA